MKKTEYVTAVRETRSRMEYRRVWLGDDGHHYIKLDGKTKNITGTPAERWMELDTASRCGVSRQTW